MRPHHPIDTVAAQEAGTTLDTPPLHRGPAPSPPALSHAVGEGARRAASTPGGPPDAAPHPQPLPRSGRGDQKRSPAFRCPRAAQPPRQTPLPAREGAGGWEEFPLLLSPPSRAGKGAGGAPPQYRGPGNPHPRPLSLRRRGALISRAAQPPRQTPLPAREGAGGWEEFHLLLSPPSRAGKGAGGAPPHYLGPGNPHPRPLPLRRRGTRAPSYSLGHPADKKRPGIAAGPLL